MKGCWHLHMTDLEVAVPSPSAASVAHCFGAMTETPLLIQNAGVPRWTQSKDVRS
jgi:hypothetical protein